MLTLLVALSLIDTDVSRMQGHWKTVAVLFEGKDITAHTSGFKKQRLDITGDKVDNGHVKAVITLDPTAKPRRFLWTRIDTGHKGYYIYRFEGEKFHLANYINNGPKDQYPTDFDGKDVMVEVWEHYKEKPSPIPPLDVTDGKTDLKRLQGTWQHVAILDEDYENVIPADVKAAKIRYRFRGDKIDNPTGADLTFTLDTAASPRRMTWTRTEGDAKYETREIYRLDGDRLYLAYWTDGDQKGYPKDFVHNGKVAVHVWERVKIQP